MDKDYISRTEYMKHKEDDRKDHLLIKKSIDKIGDDYSTLKEVVIRLEEQVKNIGQKVFDNGEQIEEFIKGSRTIFASKLTEKIVYGMIAMILVAFTGFLINLAIGSNRIEGEHEQLVELLKQVQSVEIVK